MKFRDRFTGIIYDVHSELLIPQYRKNIDRFAELTEVVPVTASDIKEEKKIEKKTNRTPRKSKVV